MTTGTQMYQHGGQVSRAACKFYKTMNFLMYYIIFERIFSYLTCGVSLYSKKNPGLSLKPNFYEFINLVSIQKTIY